jgi:hypothetical protein
MKAGKAEDAYAKHGLSPRQLGETRSWANLMQPLYTNESPEQVTQGHMPGFELFLPRRGGHPSFPG